MATNVGSPHQDSPAGPHPAGEGVAVRVEATPQRPPGRDWLKVLLKVIVSAALLTVLLFRWDVGTLVSNLEHLTPGWVLLAWGYYALCQLLSSYRWQLLLHAKDIRVPLTKLFSFYMIGMFCNNFLPSAVGGDAVKTYFLYRCTGKGRYAIISVFLERFTGLIGLSVLSVAALALSFERIESPLILAAVGGTALILFAMVLVIWCDRFSQPLLRLVGWIFPRSLGEKLQLLYEALAGYRTHPRTLLLAVALSMVIQAMYALHYSLLSFGLGIPISPFYFILFLPLVTLVTLLPISFGGLGLREVLMVWLFGEVGVPASNILAVSLTVYLLNTLLSLWGGVLLTFTRPAAVVAEGGGDSYYPGQKVGQAFQPDAAPPSGWKA